MLKFITRFFALVGFTVVLLVGGGVALAVHMHEKKSAEPANIVLKIDFSLPVVEQDDPSPLDIAKGGHDSIVLLDILHAIDRARDDTHVKGIVAYFGSEQPALSHAQEIRAALNRFHKSGKFTYAFGTDFGEFGLGNRAYYLASAFDNIWLQPVGTVSLTGLSLQSPFARSALDKIGVTADFMQREEYKSFMEPGMRDNFSPPVKAEMQAMIENLSDQIASGIAESRKWDAVKVKDLMAKGPYTDEEAVQAGLVTRLADLADLNDEVRQKAGDNVKQVTVNAYLGYSEGGKEKPAAAATKIAMIYGNGLITEHGSDGGLASEHAMGADSISDAFNKAAADKNIKAILFRVDSPGGSPTASETIRRAIIHAQKKGKPVIVSMGDVAASGGYWVAMNADRIIADPGTLTGSIGVVSGKFAVDGLLQKLGLSIDGVATSPNAGMWDMTAPFTPAQRERVNALLDNSYHAFIANVSAARKIPIEKMADIAKGRVWTGAQAVQIGLVDELGGYDVAVGAIRQTLKLNDNDIVDLQEFPPQLTPAERLFKILHKVGTETAMVSLSLPLLEKLNAAFQPYLGLGAVARRPVSATLPAWSNFRE